MIVIVKPLKIVLKKHARNCIDEWVSPESRQLHFGRTGKKIKHTTAFIVWRCGNPDCPALLAIPEYDVDRALELSDLSREHLERQWPSRWGWGH